MISCCKLVIFLFAGCFLGIQDGTADDTRILKLEQEVTNLRQTVVDLQRKVDTQDDGHSSIVNLIKNGVAIGHAFAHGSNQDGGLYVTSTIAATVELQQGDEVWVQNMGDTSAGDELDGNDWSTFSGHLIAVM